MELFHTSPGAIAQIRDNGRFGSFLSFSSKPYVMTAASSPLTYRITIAEDQIIKASSLFYHEDASKLEPIVSEVAELAGVDAETAERLIEQRDSIFNVDAGIDPAELAELDWDIQAAAARAARELGYRGVSMRDEQGSVYLIDMLGREADLQEVTEYEAGYAARKDRD